MARFSVIKKNNLITVRHKKMGAFKFNMQDVDAFDKNLINGVFKIDIHKTNEILYSAPPSIPLKTYFNKGIDKEKMYSVFAQLLNIEAQIKDHSMNLYNLVLDENYIFVTEPAGQVFVIYEPLFSYSTGKNLQSFYAEYLSKIKPRDIRVVGDMQYFISYLREPVYKDLDTMTKFINAACPEVYQKIRKPGSGKSNFLAPDMSEYQRHYGVTNDFSHPSQRFDTGNEMVFGSFANGENQNLRNQTNFGMPSPAPNIMYSQSEDSGTTLLMADDDGGTTLLSENASMGGGQNTPRAYLKRLKTGEEYSIISNETTIGKSTENNICLSDNNTISRHHAKIIYSPMDGFSFIDLNSSNHSYINNAIVGANFPVRLQNGIRIRLSNEDFEFIMS